MDTVKGIFGFGLLGVAIWLLERLAPGSVALILWAVWLIAAGVYLGAFEFVPKASGQRFAGTYTGSIDPCQGLSKNKRKKQMKQYISYGFLLIFYFLPDLKQ